MTATATMASTVCAGYECFDNNELEEDSTTTTTTTTTDSSSVTTPRELKKYSKSFRITVIDSAKKTPANSPAYSTMTNDDLLLLSHTTSGGGIVELEEQEDLRLGRRSVLLFGSPSLSVGALTLENNPHDTLLPATTPGEDALPSVASYQTLDLSPTLLSVDLNEEVWSDPSSYFVKMTNESRMMMTTTMANTNGKIASLSSTAAPYECFDNNELEENSTTTTTTTTMDRSSVTTPCDLMTYSKNFRVTFLGSAEKTPANSPAFPRMTNDNILLLSRTTGGGGIVEPEEQEDLRLGRRSVVSFGSPSSSVDALTLENNPHDTLLPATPGDALLPSVASPPAADSSNSTLLPPHVKEEIWFHLLKDATQPLKVEFGVLKEENNKRIGVLLSASPGNTLPSVASRLPAVDCNPTLLAHLEDKGIWSNLSLKEQIAVPKEEEKKHLVDCALVVHKHKIDFSREAMKNEIVLLTEQLESLKSEYEEKVTLLEEKLAQREQENGYLKEQIEALLAVIACARHRLS